MAVTHGATALDAATDAVVDLLDGAASLLVFRASPSTVASPGTEVATLTFSTPAFGASSAGVATANSITQDSSATGGVVAFASLQTSGSVIIVHCDVATSGGSINMPSGLTVTATDIVTCTSLTYQALSA